MRCATAFRAAPTVPAAPPTTRARSSPSEQWTSRERRPRSSARSCRSVRSSRSWSTTCRRTRTTSQQAVTDYIRDVMRRTAGADALAIVAFAAIGQLSHDGGVSAAGFARDALPLLAGWFGAALLFGACRSPSRRTFVLTWLVGITVGVAIRAAVLGRAVNGHQAAFLVTSLIFTLLLLIAFRSLLRVRRLSKVG